MSDPLGRVWPGWRPHLELSASHLLGLEDFVLSATRLADDDAFGIDSFDHQTGFEFSQEEGQIHLRAGRVRGITMAGEPVMLPSVALEARLAVHPAYDVWIDVNPIQAMDEAAGGAEREDDLLADGGGDDEGPAADAASAGGAVRSEAPPKMALRVEPAPEDKSTIWPGLYPRSLYLGRYRFQGDKVGLVQPPYVRRLGAIEPRDETWRDWVGPVRRRLDGLGGKVDRRADALLAGELLKLQFEWPALSIPQLARRFRFVAWLVAAGSRGGASDYSVLEPVPVDWNGVDLPQRLADLLPPVDAIAAPSVAGGTSEAPPPPAANLPEVAGRLIDRLIDSPVDYHAPVGLLARWRKQVSAMPAAAVGTTHADAWFDQFATAVRLLDRVRESGWARAVALISLAAMEEAANHSCPEAVLRLFDMPGTSARELADQALEALHEKEAADRRAGPIAFYYLAWAAEGFVQGRSARLRGYLERLRKGKVSGARLSPKSARPDLFLETELQWPLGVRPTRPAPLPWRSIAGPAARREGASSGGLVRVWVLGAPGAGKSRFVEWLCGSEARGLFAGGPFDLSLQLEGQGSEKRATGHLRSARGRKRALDVVEKRAFLTGEAGTAADATLAILLLDGETLGAVDRPQRLESLAASVRRLCETERDVRVAIAYGKADEYGVISPDDLRLVTKDLARYVPNLRQAEAWSSFVRPKAMVVNRLDNVNIWTPQRAMVEEMMPTRAWALENSRSLWESLAEARDGSALLNAYFVSVEPFERRFEGLADRGVGQLLVDFFDAIER